MRRPASHNHGACLAPQPGAAGVWTLGVARHRVLHPIPTGHYRALVGFAALWLKGSAGDVAISAGASSKLPSNLLAAPWPRSKDGPSSAA